MTSREATRHPGLFTAYYALLVLAAAGLMVRFSPHAARPPLLVMGLVLLLMLLADARPISLPSGGYATASGLFDMPSLVVLGPVWTAWLSIVSTVVNEGLVQRRPPIRVVHNLAAFTITFFAAAWGFDLAGGRVGSLAFPRDLPALLACGAAYFVTNSLLVSTVIGLTSGPSPWRVFQSNFLRGILHHLSFLLLGSLVVVVYFYVGPWALVLFGIPFLVARHSFGLYMEIKSDLKEFVRALTEVLDEIDPYTRHHSVRVAQYAVRLARGLRLSEREVEEVEYAALVHDLGKIGPEHQHILQKSGSLSQEEQRTLRAHPAAGADIVARVRALRGAAEIVRSHHERPDGLGYPLGLKSSEVPAGARILNVADAFDAMTSDRPYRRALTLESALSELRRGAGTQFDAEVVGCLTRLHEQGHFALLPSPSSEDLLLLRIRPLRARG
jgi:HD-GYP domain-containing protein (c-di-GMP phosphodiesterase class II)